MSTDPSKLFEELGRATAEATLLQEEAAELFVRLMADIEAMKVDLAEHRKTYETKTQKALQRQAELVEAVRLHLNGMDPLMAKLKAKESLEDRGAHGRGEA